MTRHVRWIALALLVALATIEAGCYIYAPGPPGPPPPGRAATWIPGHYNRFGEWVPGHWR
jgi:hypothetical protein